MREAKREICEGKKLFGKSIFQGSDPENFFMNSIFSPDSCVLYFVDVPFSNLVILIFFVFFLFFCRGNLRWFYKRETNRVRGWSRKLATAVLYFLDQRGTRSITREETLISPIASESSAPIIITMQPAPSFVDHETTSSAIILVTKMATKFAYKDGKEPIARQVSFNKKQKKLGPLNL